jgi:hypothetical protein
MDLEEAFHEGSGNVGAGIMLYLEQEQRGDTESELGTLLALEKLKGCPAYVYFEEARLWAAKKQWQLAWMAWENYVHHRGQ